MESSGAGLGNVVFMQLDQLQLARKQQGIATQFLVRVKDGQDPTEVARRIDEHFAGDERQTDTKSMQAFVAGAVGEIAEVARSHGLPVIFESSKISARLLAEDFGVEDRGSFYDPVGALRDVVVNHLMQVVAAAAMDVKPLT